MKIPQKLNTSCCEHINCHVCKFNQFYCLNLVDIIIYDMCRLCDVIILVTIHVKMVNGMRIESIDSSDFARRMTKILILLDGLSSTRVDESFDKVQ